MIHLRMMIIACRSPNKLTIQMKSQLKPKHIIVLKSTITVHYRLRGNFSLDCISVAEPVARTCLALLGVHDTNNLEEFPCYHTGQTYHKVL